jgi:hypothetical protein
MDVATTSLVERIARVLAARRLSWNAEGGDPSAAGHVDALWPEHRDDALAILRTIREASPVMAAEGDAALWERMVLAALAEGEVEIAHPAPAAG